MTGWRMAGRCSFTGRLVFARAGARTTLFADGPDGVSVAVCAACVSWLRGFSGRRTAGSITKHSARVDVVSRAIGSGVGRASQCRGVVRRCQ